MAGSLHTQDKLVVDSPEATGQPWLPAFDQHVPARVVSAVLFENDFVVLSGEDGISDEVSSAVIDRLREAAFEVTAVTAPLPGPSMLYDTIHAALVARHVPEKPLVVVVAGAEMLSVQTVHRLITLAKLRHDEQPVLRFLLTGTPALWPILHDTGLGGLQSDPAAHVRLMPDLIHAPTDLSRTKAEHPHEPDPLLKPSPFDLPMAGPALRRQNFPVPKADGGTPRLSASPLRLRDSQAGRRVALALVGLTLAGLGVAGGVASWGVLAARSDRSAASVAATTPTVTAPVISPDDRLAILLEREDKEIAAGDPVSGSDLVETRHQIDEILPQVSTRALYALTVHDDKAGGKPVTVAGAAPASVTPAAAATQVTRVEPPPVARPGPAIPDGPKPAASAPDAPSLAGGPVDAPTEGPLHVTLHYSRGDGAAAARAMRIRTSLLARGVPVDGPVALGQVVEQSSLAYYFPQDQTAALDLAQHVLSAPALVHRLPPLGDVSLPRPGEISISIGSGISSAGDAVETTRSSGKRT